MSGPSFHHEHLLKLQDCCKPDRINHFFEHRSASFAIDLQRNWYNLQLWQPNRNICILQVIVLCKYFPTRMQIKTEDATPLWPDGTNTRKDVDRLPWWGLVNAAGEWQAFELGAKRCNYHHSVGVRQTEDRLQTTRLWSGRVKSVTLRHALGNLNNNRR